MYAQDPFYIPEPVPGESGSFTKELITAGAHHAVCCQLHNVGHQLYKNEVSLSPKAIVIFEVDQKMTGGKMAGQPMVISESFPMFMGESSKLRKMLEGWRGKPYSAEELKNFSIGGIIGRPCTLLIIHEKKKDGTMKAKIAGVLPAQGPGWVPTYIDPPEWVMKEKAAAVPPPPKQAPQAAPAPSALPTQAPGPATLTGVSSLAGAKGPATHDANGEKLPF
jgi:hypothetical protein